MVFILRACNLATHSTIRLPPSDSSMKPNFYLKKKKRLNCAS